MKISRYSIGLRDVHLYSYHGVMPQERQVGAWFTLNLEIGISNCRCAEDDNIEDTVSYADIYDIVRKEMAVPSNLLEHAGKRICESIYSAFENVTDIEITICKDTPPMGGDRLSACVTLKTKR